MGRRYTASDRAKALGVAVIAGPTAAAEATGIPKSTVREWLQAPEAAEYRAKAAEAVAGDLWVGVQIGLNRVLELLPTSNDLSKVAIATGILYDKFALLTGGATSRSGTETHALSDSERADMREWLLSQRAADPPAPGSAEALVIRAATDGTQSLDWEERAQLRDWIDHLPVGAFDPIERGRLEDGAA